MSKSLRFRADGSFTIVQFTDLHWQDGGRRDLKTRALMEKVLKLEQPDLIVFTGDVIESLHCSDPRRSFREAVAVAERSGIPWAVVFGNHDTEGAVTRADLMKVQLEHKGTIAETGPPEHHGTGNFVVPLLGGGNRPAAALFFSRQRELLRDTQS
ncbi:metallophosphoesterase [Cohnella kolymensis]|uniref:metallophosphoesterase n=1 Tax=Cohnella kolymensis TaxID=1590652 RepID=UPI000B2E6B74